MPKITAIELENFQTIGKKTVIPIRDLTLMFGPNGAGKSAIFDALDLLKIILSDDWGTDCKKLKALLDKWSRNIGEKNPSKSLGLGIQIYIDEDWTSQDIPYEMFSRLDLIHHFAISSGGDYATEFLKRNLRFFIKFKDIGDTNTSWIISEMSISCDENQIFELKQDSPENYPVAYIYKNDWLSFETLDVLNKEYKDEKYSGSIITRSAPNEIGFISSARSWFDRRYEGDYELEAAFFRLSQQIIDFFKILITVELSDTALVKASRTVPTISEAISIIPGDKRSGANGINPGYRLEWSPMLKTLEGTINKGESHWTYMCELVAASLTSDRDEINDDWFDLSYLGRINSLLREELFIENGYQLTGEVFCVTPLLDVEEYTFENSKFYPKLVRLHLTDNHQRKLEIDDVGSGIGYVLPVLAALVGDDVVLIQQPELHLHPRLQSQLGEAIVRAIENKKYYRAFTIIETHSEHVLLKVMRLIRNAESRAADSLNPITFDRVSVLYFEPMPNGETQVKRLRLAPDGQLIDRWPGGFFNERFKDIFDE
ncbi:DUF3696 domain-containing protein [Polynucleobacter paneuropaeus]|nr:DUF3696 domain-containing protein [Polynucleobacter paneuropaeus]